MKEISASKKMKVPLIENGTVLDHLDVGTAFDTAYILGLKDYVKSHNNKSIVSAAMNVDSKRSPGGRKDILKIENRELDPKEVDIIALFSPHATVNTIRNYKVVEKHEVELPGELIGVVRCPHETCISNPKIYDGLVKKEPVDYKFRVKDGRLVCFYCERELLLKEKDEIYKNLIF